LITDVGWGEPQANPNDAIRMKVPMLGFACGSPQPTPANALAGQKLRCTE